MSQFQVQGVGDRRRVPATGRFVEQPSLGCTGAGHGRCFGMAERQPWITRKRVFGPQGLSVLQEIGKRTSWSLPRNLHSPSPRGEELPCGGRNRRGRDPGKVRGRPGGRPHPETTCAGQEEELLRENCASATRAPRAMGSGCPQGPRL